VLDNPVGSIGLRGVLKKKTIRHCAQKAHGRLYRVEVLQTLVMQHQVFFTNAP